MLILSSTSGYLYSDLASIYERAGRLQDRAGSVTQIPILTMPDDDITHPIPDLTGYITEGQIVLDRSLAGKSIYPPINVLPSLSRLMSDGIGEGRTRGDHQDITNQLYAAYSRARESQRLASIVGEEDISATDKLYLCFAKEFEQHFLGQSRDENRTISETLDLAWKLVMLLPEQELSRLKPADIDKYGRKKGGGEEQGFSEKKRGEKIMERMEMPATRSNLIRLKDELLFARDGLELMDQKKEILVRQISSLAARAERVRTEMNQRLSAAGQGRVFQRVGFPFRQGRPATG